MLKFLHQRMSQWDPGMPYLHLPQKWPPSLPLKPPIFLIYSITQCVCPQSLSRVWLFRDPMDCTQQAPLARIFQARILERVAISSSRSLPDAGIEPASPASPALAGGFFTTRATWKAQSLNAHVELCARNWGYNDEPFRLWPQKETGNQWLEVIMMSRVSITAEAAVGVMGARGCRAWQERWGGGHHPGV